MKIKRGFLYFLLLRPKNNTIQKQKIQRKCDKKTGRNHFNKSGTVCLFEKRRVSKLLNRKFWESLPVIIL
jgi:hypothetical protein